MNPYGPSFTIFNILGGYATHGPSILDGTFSYRKVHTHDRDSNPGPWVYEIISDSFRHHFLLRFSGLQARPESEE